MAKANSSKMQTGNQDFTSKFLQIKQGDKFFSRLLSKKRNSSSFSSSAAGDSSFRTSYYDGAAGSVPFVWESQPGTPKHTYSDTPLPPLTPPPSYTFSPNNSMQRKNSKNSKIFSSIIPRVSSKKISISPSFSSSSSLSLSSNSAPSTPMNRPSNTSKYSVASSTSAIHFGLYEEGQESISPTSTLCFGNGNGSSSKISRHYYPMKSVKRAFLSIVGLAN
ncbi:Hypothetical predicted protein [Olea europaea subsp. europaea]|uniref:Uncharacterized protein n=1 Tax=Olea europaea subsp. europaea TaxID=158383 RepID=A0A8S0V7P6_OLEEU|nr:Hypothetical predicted protein [Olea europaea subsp. europaea]